MQPAAELGREQWWKLVIPLISGLCFAGVEWGQHTARGWGLQVPLPEAHGVAALLAGAQHAWPGSSLQPWPWRGEDVHEGHPDKHRSTPCMQETTGVDKRLIPARW